MLKTKSTIQQIKLANLSLHPDIPFDVRTAIGSITHSDSYKSIFSTAALHFLLTSHPPHATINNEGMGACFAGLRIFQIAKTLLPSETKISVLSHTNFPTNKIGEIATADAFLTTLAYGLDNRSWYFDVMKIWEKLGEDVRDLYTPTLTTKKKLAKHIKTNHRLLSPKQDAVESELKGLKNRQIKLNEKET